MDADADRARADGIADGDELAIAHPGDDATLGFTILTFGGPALFPRAPDEEARAPRKVMQKVISWWTNCMSLAARVDLRRSSKST